MPDQPRDTVIIATPDASAAGMFAILDILSSVGRDWEMLHGQAPRPPAFMPRLCSVDGQPFAGLNATIITPSAALSESLRPQIVIVPDLHVDPTRPLPEDYARICAWIRSAHAAGALVTSVCSGALILAKTGLLDGHDVTTHWGYCDALAALHPKVRVRRDRVLVPSGEGHRIVTAGGATSWHDLVLYLIARFEGPEEAQRIAKLYLLQWHSEGQLPYASLTAGRNREDKVIAECQIWAADNYHDPQPVAGMVARSGLTERSFLRRFRAATGLSPRDYVQNLRVEEAKHLLERTDLTVEEIGEEVGYAEPAGFRSIFRRRVGLSPRDYRRQFQGPTLALAG